MKIDVTLKNEIKKAAKEDGYKDKLRETAEILSHRYEWDNAFRKCGRAMVSICTAASISQAYPQNYDRKYREWAREIMSLLDERAARKAIGYGEFWIHPAIMQDNLYSFMKLVCED